MVAVVFAGSQPAAAFAFAVTTTLPGRRVSSATFSASPETVLTTVPARRTVTASVPAEAGWMRATALSFP